MGFAEEQGVQVTLLNIDPPEVSHTKFFSITGDATQMVQFADRQFDVVFSNSVIEHVGGLAQQRLMAQEVRRVGQRFFVQTPITFSPARTALFVHRISLAAFGYACLAARPFQSWVASTCTR